VEAGQEGHAHEAEDGHHDHPHQFLICRTCGTTSEISDPAITAALASASAEAGFTLHRATVEAEGVCADCADPA
jgi:Fur family zinc uptake transcriptional regulator